MITVWVDHLKFFSKIRADKKIIINSHPTFSGKSTVEIRTDIFQKEQANNDYKMVSSALFLMAARNANEYSKPYLVPKIKFDCEKDHKGCML